MRYLFKENVRMTLSIKYTENSVRQNAKSSGSRSVSSTPRVSIMTRKIFGLFKNRNQAPSASAVSEEEKNIPAKRKNPSITMSRLLDIFSTLRNQAATNIKTEKEENENNHGDGDSSESFV